MTYFLSLNQYRWGAGAHRCAYPLTLPVLTDRAPPSPLQGEGRSEAA